MVGPLRGALIGYGFIAESGHRPEYQRRAETEIRAVADVSPERRAAAARAFPGARMYRDHLTLLEHEASRLDFVDITAPPYAHAEIARAALLQGLHVLCEKPLAVSAEEARSMAEQAKSARRVLFPCHNYRHAPVVEEVRRILASDAIGPVHLVTLQTFRTTHARGVSGWRPDWRRDRKFAGGGIAMDHGSHTFYLAFEWLRSYPTSVTAKLGTLGAYDTEDNLSCTLTFPTGIATAHLTWTAGARKVLYTLHGARGAIIVDDDTISLHRSDNGRSQLVSTKLAASQWMDASHKEWFGRLFDEFREAIRVGAFVSEHTVDAIKCIETIGAAYASARRNSREVEIGDPERERPREQGFRAAQTRLVAGT